MTLQAGSHVGVYQIVAPLGAGGMGEVYRARDTRLNRQVALKVLPEAIAGDHDRIARFTREAQMLAALNHPNIAAIYGVEDTGSGPALVLEYIDGETLAERIKRGPLPLDEVIRIALQIAVALEAAHEKAVIHRDLKPANVKITTEGVVKVLDFGLAKALESETPVSSPQLSQSPTLSLAATGAGMILGTAGYMAPEQARGLAVDRRSDIWAYGVVLFEMLSSRPLFEGETVADTFANLLQREPDWTQLPAHTPAGLRTLVKRCLAKNPKDRLQAIGDARILLEEMQADPSAREAAVEGPAYPLWRKLLPWALAPLFLVAGYLIRPSAATPEPPPAAFELPLPKQYLAHNFRPGLAVSPNGRKVAWVGGQIDLQAPPRIYVRDLERWDGVPIPGTEGAWGVLFSPDGEWLAFQQGQQIKKVALGGGTPVVLVEKLNNQGTGWGPAGISWGKNGTLVFPQALGVGLSMVRDSGGEPQEFTTLDAKANESSHRLPHFLPDGSAVLFTVLRYTNITPNWKRAQVWVKPLNGERKLLLEDAMDAQYAGNGVLVFARQGKLYGVHFDPSSLTVSGTPVQLLDNVQQSLYGTAAVMWTGAAQYSLAENGTLFYGPGPLEPPVYSSFSWVDHAGTMTPIADMKPMARFAPRLLPDQRRVAYSELHVNKDVWVFDTSRGTEDRATYEGQNAFPIWSRDGRMAFRSDRAGPLGIYLVSDSNWRQVTQLTTGPQDVPSSWSPDGTQLVFTRGFSATGGNTDIYVASIGTTNDIRPLIASSASEAFPEISPDGKWLAYTSDEGGRSQLYVQSFMQPGKRVTITSSDVTISEPAWSLNSKELFYRAANAIMSVRYTDTAEFLPEKAVKLFQYVPAIGGTSVRASYDVTRDGRFLVNQTVQQSAAERNRLISPQTLRLVLNWTTGVERVLAAN